MAVFVQPHFNTSFKEPIPMSSRVLQEVLKANQQYSSNSGKKSDLAMPSAALRHP